MPLVVSPTPATRRDVEFLRLDSVSWDDYQRLLAMVGDRRLFVTFDGATLEIMSPSLRHDRVSRIISKFVEVVGEVRGIPLLNIGTTTLRSAVEGKGLEPDEAFYISNEALMRSRDTLDLSVDPAPDLVIEVEVAHGTVPRLPIYASLGVKEIWHYHERTVSILLLNNTNEYSSIGTSIHLPGVGPLDVERFVELALAIDPLTWSRMLREWAGSLKST